jgi:hypothetical protein
MIVKKKDMNEDGCEVRTMFYWIILNTVENPDLQDFPTLATSDIPVVEPNLIKVQFNTDSIKSASSCFYHCVILNDSSENLEEKIFYIFLI